jgi:hypothetical protein
MALTAGTGIGPYEITTQIGGGHSARAWEDA